MKKDMYHPFLIGKNIYLRGLEKKDIDTNYFQWLNDQETTSYMYKGVYPNTYEAMEEYYNLSVSSPDLVVFAVVARQNNKHLGNISLQNIDWRCRKAELGIIIGEKSAWGKGYALEAFRLVIAYGFEQLNLFKIYSSANAENIKAIIINKKAGFKKEGILKKEIYRNGKYYDRYYMGIFREEYFEEIKNRSKKA